MTLLVYGLMGGAGVNIDIHTKIIKAVYRALKKSRFGLVFNPQEDVVFIESGCWSGSSKKIFITIEDIADPMTSGRILTELRNDSFNCVIHNPD